MNPLKFKTPALAFLVTLLLGQPLRAAEYFLSPTGSDANPGTAESTSLKTSEAADKKLAPGDTLTLLDGTYPAMIIDKSGAPEAWITIRAKNPRQAVISLAAGWHGSASNCVTLIHTAYIKVAGLTVVGCAATDHTIVDAGHGISINGCHHILVQNCRVKDCSGGGIGGYDKYWDKSGAQNGPLDFITIEGNEVSGCAHWCKYLSSGIGLCNAKDAGMGRDPSGYNFVIRNNICYTNENMIGEYTKNIKDPLTATDGNGIIIDTFTPNNHYPYAVLVEGNLCYDNGGRGIHVFNSGNTTVRYNTCWHNNRNKLDYSGDHTEGEISCVFATGVEIDHNITVANTTAWSSSITVVGSSRITLSDNLFNGPQHILDSKAVTLTNTLTADPHFANPSANPAIANFHPDATSAAASLGACAPRPAIPAKPPL